VRGLRSQGFQKSTYGKQCVYATADGRHCAWGWVDPSTWSLPPLTPDVPDNTPTSSSAIGDLRNAKFGLAGKLSSADITFVYQLQQAHDGACDAFDMIRRLQDLALRHCLTYPED
jgi:hypothetical protein